LVVVCVVDEVVVVADAAAVEVELEVDAEPPPPHPAIATAAKIVLSSAFFIRTAPVLARKSSTFRVQDTPGVETFRNHLTDRPRCSTGRSAAGSG
jgi:hypothetical protein